MELGPSPKGQQRKGEYSGSKETSEEREARDAAANHFGLTLRVILVIAAVVCGFLLAGEGIARVYGAAIGVLFAVCAMVFVAWIRPSPKGRLIGAAAGAVLGLVVAILASLVLSLTTISPTPRSALVLGIALFAVYVCTTLGAVKWDELSAKGDAEASEAPRASAGESMKVLDTSVIIDGRLVEVAEAKFLEGTLIIPQFVLHELQTVADSSDAVKRQRGRRGLEILERMRKISGVVVQIVEEDFPETPEVDLKLIQVARLHGAKLVTNDLNLNKVATLQGLGVLNVNQLANALKPAVLPGEILHVFILREGKEYNQGVAYLDDGTMVVVDGARKLINKAVDVTVTSVHQTTAGKMIFGRVDERTEQPGQAAHAAAAGSSDTRPGNGTPADRHPKPIHPETHRSQ